MKIIYSSPESEYSKILVLSLEGLNYTVSFNELDKEQMYTYFGKKSKMFFSLQKNLRNCAEKIL